MSEGLSSTTEIELFEGNIAKFFLTIGRANGGQEYEDAHIHWILGDAPKSTHNVVVRSNIPPELVEEKIGDVMAVSRGHQRSCMWKVTPSSRPLDLADRLLDHGFVNIANPAGMVKDLGDLPALDLADGVMIERVVTEGQLDDWLEVMRNGFGLAADMIRWQKAALMTVGFEVNGAIRHYIAYWEGKPAGISTVFLDGEVAGIYYVATVPAVRNKGIGTAVTLVALQDARAEGCRLAGLEASTMGYPVYARMGFREVCRVGRYEYDGGA
jgi:GNAT superfamily N-acetyltransferase